MAATFNAPFNPFTIRVDNGAADAGTTNYTTTRGLYVIDAIVRKTNAAGGAGPDTVSFGEAANIITTVNLAVGVMGADNTVVRASSSGVATSGLTTANCDIAAGGTLRVIVTQAGVEDVAFNADVICIPN